MESATCGLGNFIGDSLATATAGEGGGGRGVWAGDSKGGRRRAGGDRRYAPEG